MNTITKLAGDDGSSHKVAVGVVIYHRKGCAVNVPVRVANGLRVSRSWRELFYCALLDQCTKRILQIDAKGDIEIALVWCRCSRIRCSARLRLRALNLLQKGGGAL